MSHSHTQAAQTHHHQQQRSQQPPTYRSQASPGNSNPNPQHIASHPLPNPTVHNSHGSPITYPSGTSANRNKRPRTPSSTSVPTPTPKNYPDNIRSGTGTPNEQPTPKAMRTIELHPVSHPLVSGTGTTSTTATSATTFDATIAPTNQQSANTTSGATRALLCTLPPTCNPPNRPTPLDNSKELERHYATYHAHVCEQRGCGCVFPEARILELHQTECHDPIAALRRDRGEKIFACHLASCPRLFAAPKTRRLHLIQAHGYPKEYFFAVTNKGVGGLLKKWGEGASMVRGPWKARDRKDVVGEDEDADEDETDEGNDDNGDSDVRKGGYDNGRGDHPRIQDQAYRQESDDSVLVEEDDDEDDEAQDESNGQSESGKNGVDQLTDAMGSLALVPPNIRFGRGAKRGGVLVGGGGVPNGGGRGHNRERGRGNDRGRGRASQGQGRGRKDNAHAGRNGEEKEKEGGTRDHDGDAGGMDVDRASSPPTRGGRGGGFGRGGRGRGGYVPRGLGSGRGRAMFSLRGIR